MFNKELISEIVPTRLSEIKMIEQDGNNICIYHTCNCCSTSINIYELVEKIKIKIKSYEYDILISVLHDNKAWVQLIAKTGDKRKPSSPYFHGEDELECLIKGYDWIKAKEC